MALSESVVLRIEEALAKLEKLDARLTALFGKQHVLKVSTAQANKQVAQLSKAITSAVEKPRTVTLSTSAATRQISKLKTQIAALDTRITLDANTSKAATKIATLKTALDSLGKAPRDLSNISGSLTKLATAAHAIKPGTISQLAALGESINKIGGDTTRLTNTSRSLKTFAGSIQQAAEAAATLKPAHLGRLAAIGEAFDQLARTTTLSRPQTAALRDLRLGLTQIARVSNDFTDASIKRITAIGEAAKALGAGIRPINAASRTLGQSLTSLKTALQSFDVPDEAAQRLTRLFDQIETSGKTAGTVARNIANLSRSIQSLQTSLTRLNATPPDITGLASTLNSVAAAAAKADETALAVRNLSGATERFDVASRNAAQSARRTAQTLNEAVEAANAFNLELHKSNISLPTLATQLSRFGRGMSLYVTAPMVAAVAASSALAFQFNDTIVRIRLLTSAISFTQDQFQKIVAGIKDIAAETGRTPNEVARGFYFLASAVDAADARLSTLRVAAQSAAIGLGEVEKLTDTISSVINAYGRANITAAQAGDILIESIRAAKVEAEDFAPQLGRLLPLASELGLSFDQVGAALALLTRTGNSAAVASTQLRSFLLALVKPPEQASKSLAKVGLSFSDIRAALTSGGLEAAIRLLTSRFGQNEESLTRLFRRQEAYLALLQIASNDFTSFNSILQSTRTGFDNVTGSLTLFSDYQRLSPTLRLRQQFAELLNTLVGFGTAALPIVTEAFTALNAAIKQLGSLFSQPLIGGFIKIGLAAAALAGPFLLASSAVARFVVLAKVLPDIAKNIALKLLLLRSGASNVSAAMATLGISSDQLAANMQRVERITAAASKVAGAVGAAAFASFAASLAGAAFAASDGVVKFASLAGGIAALASGAALAGVQIGSLAGPIAGVAAAAATAGVGLFSMLSAIERAKKQRIDNIARDFGKQFTGLDAQEILIRFNFVPDEKQTASAAQRAVGEYRKFLKELLEGDDITEVEADIITSVIGSSKLEKDFDEAVRAYAKGNKAALETYITQLDNEVNKRMVGVLDRNLDKIRTFGDDVAQYLSDGLISTAEASRLVSKYINQLPDNIREYGRALSEANLIAAEYDRTTGEVTFSIADMVAAQRVLAEETDLSARPAIQKTIQALEETGAIAQIAADNTDKLSNSFATLTETSEGDFELIPAEALETAEDMRDAIEDIVETMRELIGLTSDKALVSGLNDAVLAAADLAETVADLEIGRPIKQAILDITDLDAEELRDEIDSISSDFIDSVAEAVTQAAKTGDKAQVDLVEFITFERFDVFAQTLAKSLGVSVEDAFAILESRGVTTDAIRNLIRNIPVEQLTADIESKKAEVAAAISAIASAAADVGVEVPLSPTFDIKDASQQMDELAAQVAVLARSSPPFVISVLAKLASSGEAGNRAIQELLAQQAISRELIVEALLKASPRGLLRADQLTNLLSNDSTRAAVIEFIAEVEANFSGKDVDEVRKEIEAKLTKGEPITIPVGVRIIDPQYRGMSPDTLERYIAMGSRSIAGAPQQTLTLRQTANRQLASTVPQQLRFEAQVDTTPAERGVNNLVAAINNTTAYLRLFVDTSQVEAALQNVGTFLRRMGASGVNITAGRPAATSRPPRRPRSGQISALAHGGVIQPEQFVGGGIARKPMIARAARGRGILWAEPETHGEAYIPFNPRHRNRATDILGYVAERFGFSLAPRVAANGLVVDIPQTAPRVEGVSSLAAAVASLAASISKLAESVQEDDSPSRDTPLVGTVSITSTIQDPRAAAMHFASELSRVLR